MLRTSSCASQYAATCCSKNTPSPPVEIGLETRFWLESTMQSTKCFTVSFVFGSWDRFRTVCDWEGLLTVPDPFGP